MKKIFFLLLSVSLLFFACTKDRTFPSQSSGVNTDIGPTPNNPFGGAIKINEFMANETKAPSINEFGTVSDWLELYNNTSTDISIQANQWFVDTLGMPTPFALPAMTFPAHGFAVVWCDKLNETTTNPDPNLKIHSSFPLKKASGILEVRYKDATDTMRLINVVSYGAQTTDVSYGRNPDGSTQWQSFTTPTPGKTNN